MENIERLEGEIRAMKSLLSNSDYQLLKLVENLTDCTTITGLISCFKSFLSSTGTLVQRRRAWRAKINELEEQLDKLLAAENENGDAE